MRKLAAIAALSMLVAACGDKPETAASEGEAPAAEQAEASGGSSNLLNQRPGLWETVSDDGDSVQTSRQCILDVSKAEAELNKPAEEGCTKTLRNVRGGVALRHVCPQQSSEMELVITGTATQKDLVTTLKVNDQEVTIRQKLRWVGPCPAGMQDGDEVEAGE